MDEGARLAAWPAKKIDDASAAVALADQCFAALGDSKLRAAFFDRMLTAHMRQDHLRVFWGDRLLSLDKSMGFLDDPRFAQAYGQIRGSLAYDHYDSPHTIAWRLHTLVWAAQNALAIGGDFVECGVFKGDFAWVVAELTNFSSVAKTFYLYDTFEGFAPAYSSPADFPDDPGFYEFAHKVYSDPTIYSEVCRKLAAYKNIKIVRGVLPDSLAEAAPDGIAFLHMDLNSPAAEVASLDILFERVTRGGVIIFDDYGWHVFRKQKEAHDAFMAARDQRILELPTGQGLVVKR